MVINFHLPICFLLRCWVDVVLVDIRNKKGGGWRKSRAQEKKDARDRVINKKERNMKKRMNKKSHSCRMESTICAVLKIEYGMHVCIII